jgi:hypothetical protein
MNAEIEASDIVSFNYFHKWERVSIIVKYTSLIKPKTSVQNDVIMKRMLTIDD